MNVEDQLRRGLRARAEEVEPRPDALGRIHARVAAAHRARRRRHAALVGAVAAVMLLAVAVPLALVGGDDDREVRTADAPTTTAAPDPAPSDPAPSATAAVVPAAAVWPTGPSSYGDPEAVAEAFMREYVGMPSPFVVEVQQGDARSGEVLVRPRADFEGLVTRVLVRQGEADAWYVVGSVADDIRLARPSALDTVSSPVTVSGESTAFEGTVQVEVRQDGGAAGEALGSGFVNGGAGFDLEPFEGEIAFEQPSAGGGAVVAFTVSAEDGTVEQATVVRVLFADAP